MKNFQTYFYEANKVYEFRIKLAGVNPRGEILERIKNALDAYQLETVSAVKRLPIQEHREFPKAGAIDCYMFEIGVKYPTIAPQIRQLIAERAQINADWVCVLTKNQGSYEDATQEQINSANSPVLEDPELATESGQELAGQARIGSLLKELESRKHEFAEGGNEQAKTTNELPQGNVSPIGTTKNTIPSPVKGQK